MCSLARPWMCRARPSSSLLSRVCVRSATWQAARAPLAGGLSRRVARTPTPPPRAQLSMEAQANPAVWLQWDDWLSKDFEPDSDEQEAFYYQMQMRQQAYYVHVGMAEYDPHAPVHERLYTVASAFTAEDDTMLTIHDGDTVEMLEADNGDGWMHARVFTGEGEYIGFIPSEHVDHENAVEQNSKEAALYAMSKWWHDDDSVASQLLVHEESRVSELVEHIANGMGVNADEVTLQADSETGSEVLDADDYLGSSLFNSVVSVDIAGTGGCMINDGTMLLPYFEQIQRFQHSMVREPASLEDWEQSQQNAQETDVVLAALWYRSSCEQSMALLAELEEMADEFRGVEFNSIDLDNTPEITSPSGSAPAFSVLVAGELVASSASVTSIDEIRDAITPHRVAPSV